jgi:hypothetical protein
MVIDYTNQIGSIPVFVRSLIVFAIRDDTLWKRELYWKIAYTNRVPADWRNSFPAKRRIILWRARRPNS